MRPQILIACLIASINLASASLFASGSSENAVVIVNAGSATSKLVANYYIHHRKIPENNVVYLNDIPRKEMMTVADFRKKILIPIIATISQRKLAVDYLIYSSDFPTIIDAKSDRAKLIKQGNKESKVAANSKFFTPHVSLTAATYYYQRVLAENPSYLSLNANKYVRMSAHTLLNNPFYDVDHMNFEKAVRKSKTGKYDEALELLIPLAEKHPLQIAVLYWIARTYARQSDSANAVGWLKRAVAAGWCYRTYTETDSAFTKLIADQDFRALLKLIPNLPFRYTPTQSFRSAYHWGKNGMINSTDDQGDKYLLSTVLAVNRNGGTSEKDTLKYLGQSIVADGTRPQGKFYFTKTSDVRTKTRFKGFRDAISELKQLGYDSEIVESKLPTGKNDIVGMTIGAHKFDFESARSSIRRGAICENLTSYGGRFSSPGGQTKMTELLRFGAAGTSGTVVEPYALQAKFPEPRIHVHYVRGCTLAEAFYQSVAGPFQLLVVGDALCKPWAKLPKVDLTGDILSTESLSGTIEFKADCSHSPVPVRLIELHIDGRLVRRIEGHTTGPINLDTTTIPDGYHELRFVAVGGSTISSRASAIASVSFNNANQIVNIRPKNESINIDDTASFSVSAEGATEIRLLHNGRVLAKSEQEQAILKVPAHEFGRGPVTVEAIASFDGKTIRSRKVQLRINGEISTKVPVLKATPKKRPAKPKKPALKKPVKK